MYSVLCDDVICVVQTTVVLQVDFETSQQSPAPRHTAHPTDDAFSSLTSVVSGPLN